MNTDLLFAHLPDLADQLGSEHVAALIDRSEVMDLPEGTVLIRDQDPIDSLYLVLSGRLRICIEVADHSISFGELTEGNWVGEMALFSGENVASSTVTAASATSVLRLGFDAFQAMREADPLAAGRLTHVLIAMLIKRLRATANDPILDPEGQLIILGDLNVPAERLGHHRQGLLSALKSLFGVH